MQDINGQTLTLINKGWADKVLGKHANVCYDFVCSVIKIPVRLKVWSSLGQHVQHGPQASIDIWIFDVPLSPGTSYSAQLVFQLTPSLFNVIQIPV